VAEWFFIGGGGGPGLYVGPDAGCSDIFRDFPGTVP
jgi:hypothetical protein